MCVELSRATNSARITMQTNISRLGTGHSIYILLEIQFNKSNDNFMRIQFFFFIIILAPVEIGSTQSGNRKTKRKYNGKSPRFQWSLYALDLLILHGARVSIIIRSRYHACLCLSSVLAEPIFVVLLVLAQHQSIRCIVEPKCDRHVRRMPHPFIYWNGIDRINNAGIKGRNFFLCSA